jgi:UDP-galactopyranose mutase
MPGAATDGPEAPSAALDAARRESAVVIFGPDNWSDYPQTRHHVAAALAARGWPVTYTTGPHFVWDVAKPKWAHARWRTTAGAADGVVLNWPGRTQLRWPRFGAWDHRVLNRFADALACDAGWHAAQHRIAYLFRPEFVGCLDRLGDCRVVYHADDSFSKTPGWSPESRADEATLVARADLIVASSHGVRRNLPGDGPDRARALPNGADVEMFAAAAASSCPPDIAAIPRPRIGYFGWLNPKIDFRLVADVAALRPDWHWVLVGPATEPAIAADPRSREAWRALRRMANVHVIGPRPYRDIPAYQAHMDVNTMCYRSDPGGWWEDLSPLKLYEYLAVGRPVVACALEALEPLRDVIAIARGGEEWTAAIEAALRGRNPADIERGRRIARENGWTAVAARLETWLVRLIAPDGI